MKKSKLVFILCIACAFTVVFFTILTCFWQHFNGDTFEKVAQATVHSLIITSAIIGFEFYGDFLKKRHARIFYKKRLAQMKQDDPGCENGKYPERCRYRPHSIRAPSLMIHPRPAPSAR